MLPRRAKIVCTIGPASSSLERLEQLIDAGMDVARLNFSHGTHEEHGEVIKHLREVSSRRRKAIAILGDLCGPKIRLGKLPGGPRMLEQGSEVRLFTGTEAHDDALPVRYDTLVDDLREGQVIHLDDARIALRVVAVDAPFVRCVVDEPGQVRSNVGVHLPSGHLQITALTEKDKQDLMFCLSAGVDYVAISFVRSPDDVKHVREVCDAWGTRLPIVSKIETPQAIERIEAIVKVSDAVMVARGDLGVEFPPERVPVLQKNIIETATRHRRPVIVATEMLHSMVTNTRPTRAEASDVANAIYAGADATMLSQETAAGAHPALAVQMMARIVSAAEQSPFYQFQSPPRTPGPAGFPEAVARMAALAARDTDAKLIAVFTQGGETARLVSAERPHVPVIAFSPNQSIRRRIGLYWGVLARVLLPVRDPDEMVDLVQQHLLAEGTVSPGDRVVVVYGAPISLAGRTNTVRVHQIVS